MTVDLTQEQAQEIYDAVRLTFPAGELPNANFEEAPWFFDDDEKAWCRQNGDARMMVCEGRQGIPYVAARFCHKGTWYTSERYFADGRNDR